jgi:hypothetical protein
MEPLDPEDVIWMRSAHDITLLFGNDIRIVEAENAKWWLEIIGVGDEVILPIVYPGRLISDPRRIGRAPALCWATCVQSAVKTIAIQHGAVEKTKIS